MNKSPDGLRATKEAFGSTRCSRAERAELLGFSVTRSANWPRLVLVRPPIPSGRGPFLFVMTSAADGSDEQIFGVNEQILGQDQSD
jgi:hypothetical protein